MDIGIVIPTGRNVLQDTLTSLKNNFKQYGHFNDNNMSLHISWDPGFYELGAADFKIPNGIASHFDAVNYIGPRKRLEMAKNVAEEKQISQDITKTIFYTRGVSSQKNAAMYDALMNGNKDAIIFLDDDEYPNTPLLKKPKLEWIAQDFLGSHLENLTNGAEITSGYHSGYLSPAPSQYSDFEAIKDLLQRLGEAIGQGNEAIGKDSFLNKELVETGSDVLNYSSKVVYTDERILQEEPKEMVARNGGKWVSGGHLGVSAGLISEGLIPPFYTPVGARGDDTFFSMRILDRDVYRIPTYMFHDPFQKYKGITRGEMPDTLEDIQATTGTIDRFAKACDGWIKYAPLLILMQMGKENYDEKILLMKNELEKVGPSLSNALENPLFEELFQTLKKYDSTVDEDRDMLGVVNVAWKEIVNGI